MRARSRTAGAVCAVVVLVPLAASPTVADIAQSSVVSADPVNNTPHVLDGTVRDIAVIGSRVVVGGNFTQVREAGSGKPTLSIRNLFAFDPSTGKIDTAFEPSPDSTVYALEPGPSSGTVYAGGSFKNVGGKATGQLALLSVPSGAPVATFQPKVQYGRVSEVIRRGGKLYVGGAFTRIGGKDRAALARVNASTGALDSTFTIAPSTPRRGTLKVQELIVNPAGTRMVINGTFTRVNGARRYQIAMVDTGASPAALTSWSTERYSSPCNDSTDTYMRGMDFAPDGSYFVVVTTGGPYGSSQMCDTAARWETGRTGSGQAPTWVNWTGGDTLLSTAVTGAAVYVGGHQRWHDNPQGYDFAGPGAVSRPGIAALSPSSGKALSWNPTRTRGHGVEALVATSNGLYVGSDTEELGKEYHARIGRFPLP